MKGGNPFSNALFPRRGNIFDDIKKYIETTAKENKPKTEWEKKVANAFR